MTYEEAKDRLDKHAQYCLDGQDLYALEIVLEQSINKSVIENIKAEIDCINREEALKLFTWTNTKEDIWNGLKDLPSVQPMPESYQEEKKADKKQVKSAMEGFTSFMRVICNNDKLGVPKEIADEFGISEEYRRKSYSFDERFEKLEPKTGWIPVSERLPEDNYAVLVWCPERKNIYCAYRDENQWWIFGAFFEKIRLDVLAWQPLPEPYKAESEDKR